MKINKERTGCGLSVRTDLSAAALKEKMNYAAECIDGIFVPSEVVWEGDRYAFYISHRQSLKEYIYENGIRLEDFIMLIRQISLLFSKASEHGIAPHEFIFDYECIFIGSSFSDLEFIYAPDSDAYKDGAVVYNKCSDMAAIVSLHIEYGNSEQIEKMEAAVTEALRILSDWETMLTAETCIFPKEQVLPLLEQWSSRKHANRLVSTWFPFAAFECGAACVLAGRLIMQRGESVNAFLAAVWLVLMLCIGYLLLPEKKPETHKDKKETYKYNTREIRNRIGEIRRIFRKVTNRKEVCEMELNGDMLLKGVKYTINEEAYDEIHIGRDDTWADIPVGLTFVSRKHAMLYKQNDKWYIKDLKSTNGTFVNGAKIAPEQPLSLKNGSEISLGIPESKFIFRLP
ncbi:MAG: FHA domain-containing protein [Clostridia bacterium]